MRCDDYNYYFSDSGRGKGRGCLYLFILGIIIFLSFSIYDQYNNSASIPMESKRLELEQVMEHESNHYSVKYKAENNELIEINFGRQNNSVKIIADVPEGEPIWGLLNRAKTPRGRIDYLGGEIHVHSGQDINGGGWNHGKYGSGQTVPVESS